MCMYVRINCRSRYIYPGSVPIGAQPERGEINRWRAFSQARSVLSNPTASQDVGSSHLYHPELSEAISRFQLCEKVVNQLGVAIFHRLLTSLVEGFFIAKVYLRPNAQTDRDVPRYLRQAEGPIRTTLAGGGGADRFRFCCALSRARYSSAQHDDRKGSAHCGHCFGWQQTSRNDGGCSLWFF